MKKKSVFQRMFMSLPELAVYYMEQRKERFQEGKRLKRIQFREALYPVFITLLKVDRMFRRQKIYVRGNQKKYKEPVIYACTHIGENDVENIYEAVLRGCWWFVGDPCVLYKSISGLWLYLNGCILLETGDKEDRRIAYLRSVELLKGGGSLIIFPEGARNGTENLPVMGLFPGTARMAMETNTKIVPVAIEQYDRRFVINFGNELSPGNYQDVAGLTQHLRDTLASLKWEIWEQEGVQRRNSLPEDYGKMFKEEFERRIVPYNTPESVEKTRYHSKAEIEQKEAFAHLDQLIPCKNNLFLFQKP